ncbi:hypothetical protein KOW79_012715 [Hemibagrus wyckioides]|uniref:Ig-like domain-containing protein n=1 Tax=Hemibagrus wyckioides TaxID=337641 RepID=A0A9D3NLT0_9TELE|nr:hypothetical protein KOW79_012715 [Hemibagrus wyckioides]
MEMYLLFFLLSCSNINGAFSDLSKPMIVRENGEITLNCSIKDHEEVAWYRLSSDQLTLLISAQKTRTVKSLPVYYNTDKNRFILKADNEIHTAMFTIRNLKEDDLGLYFCGITAEPAQMHFGRATRLMFEDKKEETTATQIPQAVEVNTDEVTKCERVLMFGGVGVAAVLLLLTTLVACTVIRHKRPSGEI